MTKDKLTFNRYSPSHLNFKGKNWEYIVTGKGKALVIFPGGGETAESNFRLIRSLENSYRIIIPTIYDVDSIHEFNEAINAILQKENIKNFILYGLSIGGLLAQTYTRDNPNRVTALALSHACTPLSSTYKKRIIYPLKITNIFLPVTSNSFIKLANRFAMKIQGSSNNIELKYPIIYTPQDQEYWRLIMTDYHKKFFNKRLIQTWVNIHLDFSKQTLNPQDFSYLKNKILILRTNNDPLMQDEGDFKRVYPDAEVYTFKDTGHLTSYYQFDLLVKVLRDFLNKIS